MEYDKPFKTYDELINLLIERGLIIENRDFAQMALSTLSYHDLINGYKECFAKNDRFSDGVTIEDLYELYLLDKSIQNVLFKYSLIVERSFKTKLAYVMSERFGIHQSEYLDKRNYSANAKRDKKVGAKKFSDLKKDIEFLMQNTLDNPIRHYRSKNHIPPWILLKNLYFSDHSIKYLV